jgi:hypothetical protein
VDRLPIPAKNYTGWSSDNSAANARTICVKRASGVDFISMSTKLKTDGTCEEGFTECGSSKTEDPNRLHAMCVDKNVNGCPVMDIFKTGPAPNPGGQALGDSATTKIFFSKVPTQTGKLPISELVVGIEHVCKNKNDLPKEPTNVGNYRLRVKGSNNQASCEGGIDETFTPFH